MPNKIIFLLILSIALIQVKSFLKTRSLSNTNKELTKYSSVDLYNLEVAYIDITDYKENSKIYLTVSFKNGYSIGSSLNIGYLESNDNTIYEKDYFTVLTSNSQSSSGNSYSFYFSLKITANKKYLLIKMPTIIDLYTDKDIETRFTLKYMKYNYTLIIIIVVVVILILIVVLFVVRRFIKRKRSQYNSGIDTPFQYNYNAQINYNLQ